MFEFVVDAGEQAAGKGQVGQVKMHGPVEPIAECRVQGEQSGDDSIELRGKIREAMVLQIEVDIADGHAARTRDQVVSLPIMGDPDIAGCGREGNFVDDMLAPPGKNHGHENHIHHVRGEIEIHIAREMLHGKPERHGASRSDRRRDAQVGET